MLYYLTKLKKTFARNTFLHQAGYTPSFYRFDFLFLYLWAFFLSLDKAVDKTIIVRLIMTSYLKLPYQ